ncbi:MAG: diguanylate cyclase [Chloroflexales bacterium]
MTLPSTNNNEFEVENTNFHSHDSELAAEITRLRIRNAELEAAQPSAVTGQPMDEAFVTWALSESQYNLLVAVDADWRITFVNTAYGRLLGQSPATLLGQIFLPPIHPDDQARTKAARCDLTTSPYHVTLEYRVLTPEGWRWLHWDEHAIRDAEGHTLAVRIIGRDITEQKQTEFLMLAQRDLAQDLARAESLDVVLPICLDIALRITNMDCGGIYLFDPNSGDLDLVYSRGLSVAFIEATRHWPANSDRAQLVRTGQSHYIQYNSDHMPVRQLSVETREDLLSVAMLPLMHQSEVIGCFNLGSHTSIEVPAATRELMQVIGTQVGHAIVRLQAEAALRDSQQEWQMLFDALLDFLFVLDLDGRIVQVNQVVLQRLGYQREELLGQSVLLVHPPDLHAAALQVINEMLTGQREVCLLDLITKNGERIPVETRVTLGHMGKREALFGVSRDVSARQQAAAVLQAKHDELKQRNEEISLLSEMSALLHSCANVAEAYQIIAYHLGQLFPDTSGALFEDCQTQQLFEAVLTWGNGTMDERIFLVENCWALRRGRPYVFDGTGANLLCRHLAGQAISGLYCVPMVAHSELIGILHFSQANGTFTPAQQRLAQMVADTVVLALANLKLRETLQIQSTSDVLTQLFNRRYMEQALARLLTQAKRLPHSLALLMLDLDHFKQFNDTYGHEAGDAILRHMGQLLLSHVRKDDVACRYGGEEFAVILATATLEVALQRAEDLRAKMAVSMPQFNGAALGPISASLGVAVFPMHGSTSEALFRAADAALYAAKDAGRNRVCVAKEPGSED